MIFLLILVILLVFGGVYTFCVNGCSTESFWRITCWDQLFLRSFLQNPEDFCGIVFHLAGTWKVCAHYYFLVNIHHIFTRLHPEMLGSGATHIPLSETTGKIPVNPNESRCCPSLCPWVLVIFGMMIPQHPSKPCPMPLLWKWKDPPRKKNNNNISTD